MRNEIVFRAIEAARPLSLAAERHIWNHPETGYREWKTHAYLKAQIEALGVATHTFDRIPASVAVQSAKDGRDRVFKPIPGFWADFETGRPGPRLAIFGELDALLIPTHPECDRETGAVHACGHNAQCAALLGVAAGLSAPGALDGLSGSVRLIAVPAEEFVERDFRKAMRDDGVIRYGGGKQELLWRGVLDDVDLAFMVHTKDGEARIATNPGSDGFIATNHVFLGTGHQSKRIGLSQVLLFGEGKLFEILRRGHRADPCFPQALSIKVICFQQTSDLSVYLLKLFIVNLQLNHSFLYYSP